MKSKKKVKKALELAVQYGQIDGSHHRLWTIDQMVRILAGKDYKKIVKEVKASGYRWDEGIAP